MKWTTHLPFPLLLAIRHQLGGARSLTALTFLSIATAVAMSSGLEMSSRSVEAELERTAAELAGMAQIEVTAGRIGVREDLLAEVARGEDVRVAVPLVEARFRITGGPGSGGSLYVIGVDLLADPEVRAYAYAGGETRVSDPLRLLADPRAVIVSDVLARDLGLVEGSTIPVKRGTESVELVVRGILAAGGVADAFGGRIAVADVYSLQTLLRREGWLDRIDVVAEPGADVETVMEGLRRRIGDRATVRASATRSEWLESTLATVRLVVSVLVLVAIAVASLLSYGALSLFVDRRSRELSLLRATGLEAARMRRLLYVDALLLAALGVAMGLALGLILSRSLIALLSGVTDFLDDVQIAHLDMTVATVLVGLLTGLVVALVGVTPSALRASWQPPLEHLVRSRPSAGAPLQSRSIWVPVAIASSWLVVSTVSLGLAPLVRVVCILGLGLAFLVFVVRRPLSWLLVGLRPGLERAFPGIGRLAGASLVTRPIQTGIHVAAVAGVLAGVTVSSILAQSLAHTLDFWTASQFPGGVIVTSQAGLSFGTEEELRPDVVEAIRTTPGVEAVFDQYGTTILFRGEEVWLSATDMRVMAEYGSLPAMDDDPADLARAIAAGGLAISDRFSQRFGVEPGDTVVLDTPTGGQSYLVAGRIRDYAGPGGSLNLDLRVFDEIWTRTGSRNVVIWTDGPVQEVIRRVEARVGDRQQLFFVYGPDLDRYASKLLSRFTRILDVLAVMIASLGGLAVLNLLLGAVSERRRELGLLRSAGATRSQIGALVLIDGLIAGLIGGGAGLALGVACAYPLVGTVVPQALGWTLSFWFDPAKLASLLLGVAAASLLASAYPAWLARQVATKEVLAPE